MRKIIFIAPLLIVIAMIFVVIRVQKTFGSPIEIRDQNISGKIRRDQIWSGNIHVSGDINVSKGRTLTILPGTIVNVAAMSDDQGGGKDHPHDPPFPKDPDRTETKSTQIIIKGTINAIGTQDKKITFTSDSAQPTPYDWDGLYITRGRLEYVIIEYARYNNLQETSDVVIANSTIRNALECCLCIGHAKPISPEILNNDIYNCGHEGIDNGGGSAIIKGNNFHVENPDIQPDPATGRVGVVVYQNTYPTIEDNQFEKLRRAIYFLEDSKNEKEDAKVIVRNNTIKNNDAAFGINPGFPMESVLREKNNLINNTEEETREGRGDE
ncbi:MAG: right-handed parallel beta-helix repeat-containing protein [Candidatus Kerfeldbacteria bacterium]|nr:right-handed parallel beta-helix repeat-containing protein [Candidatus Kerfeldbacteria bacterium]